MASSAEERMNLATLQHSDPFIKSIKANAKHVTLYTFKADSKEWEKTDVEGTCFVYERSAPPYHGFMILNRLGTNNFIEPITKDLEFQLQLPFLLYRNPPSIYGLWFYEVKQGESISGLLRSLVAKAKQCPPLSDLPAVTSQAPPPTIHLPQQGQVDILQLLNKAAQSSNFETARSDPPSFTSGYSGDMVKPQPVKPSSQSQPEKGKPMSLDDLFKNASISSKQNQQSAQTSRQAGQTTPQEEHAFKRPLPMDKMTTVSELERQQTPEINDPVQLLTPASLTNTHHNPQIFSTPAKLIVEETQSELMSPMAFSIARRDSSKTTTNQIPVAINPPQHVSDSMMSGFNYVHQRRTISQSSDPVPLEPDVLPTQPVSALTKEQLRQAMLYLLNNDDQFLQNLHNGYIQSLNSSLRR